MMLLPGWLTAYQAADQTLVVCDSARRPGALFHHYRVRILRAGVVTLVRWRPTERSARELYESTVECHENGLPQP